MLGWYQSLSITASATKVDPEVPPSNTCHKREWYWDPHHNQCPAWDPVKQKDYRGKNLKSNHQSKLSVNQWMLRWGHHTWKPFTNPVVFHKDRVGSRVSASPQKAANWMTYVQWPFTMKSPVSAVTLFLWLRRAVYSWHVHCSSLIDTSLPQAAIPS